MSRELGIAPEAIYKTPVVRAEPGGLLFAVIALGAELDLKGLARGLGQARRAAGALAADGCNGIRGAVTALAAKKTLPVYLDAVCLSLSQLGVSAGAPGFELILTPNDDVRATGAIAGAITLAAGQGYGTRVDRRD